MTFNIANILPGMKYLSNVFITLMCVILQWCMSGRCVPIDAQHAGLPAIDGDWSEWSDYTPCSRTCGGGVQIKRRRCNNPLYVIYGF